MKRILCLVGLGLGIIHASGQSEQIDTVLTLAEIEITASEIRNFAVGGQTTTWDSETLNKRPSNSVADLLSTETGSFIKSYGLGGLATSAIRGGSASHTLVLWNGLPLQSPMLGQLDLSLIPVETGENIHFQAGGNTAFWGSGAVAGILFLENRVDFDNRFNAESHTRVGDFGDFQQRVEVNFGNNKFQSRTKFNHRSAKNDFSYLPAPGLPERKQTNARLSQNHFLQDLYWKINDRNFVSFYFWRQDSDRQIPPTNVQTRSEANQDDKSNRFMVNWNGILGKGILKAKMALFDERLIYFDNLIGLETYNHFQSVLGEFTAHWSWRDGHQFCFGTSGAYTKAWSGGYEKAPTENKIALFGSWRWETKVWQIQAGIRNERWNSQFSPFAPMVGILFHPFTFLRVKLKISKDYRLPTLNDRFWRPGGNKSLLPESGWSEEISLVMEQEFDRFHLGGALTFFNRTIENWIMWSILEGQTYWSASNITKVWSRGVEPRLSLKYHGTHLKLSLMGGYNYVRSTNQIALDNPKLGKGEQLIYTPIHGAFWTLSLSWKTFHFAYQQVYTGKSRGVNDHLPAHEIGNIRCQYPVSLGKHFGTVFLNVNNIWDENYLVVERRPMPGIHITAGVNFLFQKNPTT